MFNLLTEEEKNNLSSEYKARRWSVFFILVFVLGLISFFLLAPTYVTVYFEKQNLVSKMEESKREAENLVDPEIFEQLKQISVLTEALAPHTEDASSVELIEMLIKRKPENVGITSFAIKKTEDGRVLKMSLAGQVLNRDVLLEFSDELKKEEWIDEVNIPLESFVRDEDLNFSLQINGRLK